MLLTREEVKEMMKSNPEIEKMVQFENAKPRIMARLLPLSRVSNGEMYTLFHDIAIVYSIVLESKTENGSQITIRILNSHLDLWDTTKTEIHKIAMENTLQRENIVLTPMKKMVEDLQGKPVEYLDDIEEAPMYVLTNKSFINGAIAILDSNIQEKIASLLNGDYYIIPSSIHEVIVIPYDLMETKELNGMIKDINNEFVSADDRLSNHAFKYNSETRKIEIQV